MAKYVVHVRSPKSPAEAFDYMADLRNFAEWDPGVLGVSQVEGHGSGLGSSFDVEVKGIVGSLTLRYETTAFESPQRVTAVAKSSLLKSVDVITVRPDGTGSIVTYDAELTLNGVFALADPLLGLTFRTIGDRAAKGLVRALDGERVAEPVA